MKFEIGDLTDSALTTTAVHEMALCQQAFDRFVYFSGLNILGEDAKSVKVQSYNAYSEFLHHLYEFYVACFKRDRRSTAKIPYGDLDALLNLEVEKLLRNRRQAIEQGYAPSWENHISVYQVEVPQNFGTDFRKLRNRAAHADPSRAVPGELSLGAFFTECHRFIVLLYQSGLAFWTVKDVEKYNWRAIEEFNAAQCR